METLLAVGTLAVGMLFIGGTFMTGVYFTTISTERTIAAVAAQEAFAKIRLYGLDPNDPGLKSNAFVPYEQVRTIPSVEFLYPSTWDASASQYSWSALCKRVSGNSRLFREHPDWVQHDLDGKPIVHWRQPARNVYRLDSSHPEAFEYLRTVFRTMRSWGATCFKTDFMDWGFQNTLHVRRRVPGKTSAQYFSEVARMIREEIGDNSYWLGCISPYQPLAGLVDAVRVSNDVMAEWNDEAVGNMFRQSFAEQWANNVLWKNDPDTLYLRHFNTKFTEQEQRSVALWNGFIGGVINTSDRFHALLPERLKLWRFLQPGPKAESARLPYWGEEKKNLAAVRQYKALKAWGVLVFNPSAVKTVETYPVAELTGEKSAYCYEWRLNESLPLGKRQELTVELDPHESKLVYINVKDLPAAPDTGLSGIRVDGMQG